MPPHCDSLDGPVVTAARRALEAGDVDLVLPFVPADDEDEVRRMFAATSTVRPLGEDARTVADLLFFETVVRLHRAGEGAPFTGLRPAGLDVGPVTPRAEQAVATGSATALTDYLVEALRHQLEHRLEVVSSLAATKDRSVTEARSWVEAALGFEVYSHHLLGAIEAPVHGHDDGRGHE
jgi:hypothetical protein